MTIGSILILKENKQKLIVQVRLCAIKVHSRLNENKYEDNENETRRKMNLLLSRRHGSYFFFLFDSLEILHNFQVKLKANAREGS